MAGQGGPDGNLRGFGVADFADEDHIGIVPQDGAKTAGEAEADIIADLDLRNALQLVLNGILDRDDLANSSSLACPRAA